MANPWTVGTAEERARPWLAPDLTVAARVAALDTATEWWRGSPPPGVLVELLHAAASQARREAREDTLVECAESLERLARGMYEPHASLVFGVASSFRLHAGASTLAGAAADVNRERPLVRCQHGKALRDHAGEVLEPSCGCTLATPGRE